MKVDALCEHSLCAVSEDTQTLTAQQKTFAADCWIGLLTAIGNFQRLGWHFSAATASTAI